ncbi:ATP-binding protein [Geomonas sp. Red32]|uniref:sensor histidine kinase n=1 Tax=Geomonas sp. Red32 TaxID=2912856 RepID=UPI00202CEAC7|nr:ATP-binding protein [Geomonas sp. Red32]MCM0083177.1 ATP-binding protein [Geomonas sp. Red32]
MLAAVLPVWLVSGWLVFHAYSVKRAQIGATMLDSARTLASVVDRDLATVQAALLALSTSPAFATGDLKSIHDQVMELLKSYPGADIIVADATGQQVVNSARPFGTPLPRRNTVETVRRIFENGQPIVSDLFFGAVTKRPLISIDIPVAKDGKVLYDLAMTFPSERMGALLRKQALPKGAYSALIDGKTVVIARTRFPERYVGKRANPFHLKTQLKEGTTAYANIEGNEVLAAYCRSGLSPWRIVVGVPKAAILATVYRWTGWALAGAGLISLFGLALALQFARRITGEIQSLIEPALAIGRGEPVPPMNSCAIGEFGLVASALERASELLQSRGRELDSTVASLKEESLQRQRSEESLRLLIDGARDYAIVLLSPDGRVTSWNEGATRLKGWEAEEILVRHFSLFYPEESVADGHPERELAIAAAEGRYEEEAWRIRKDGSAFMANVIITAIRDQDGALVGFSKVTRDITDRRDADDKLRATLVDLKRSNEELEQFAYIASHDLQEPLRMVSSYTQLLAQRYGDQLDDKAKKFIDYAVDGAVRMQRLINDLLAYSRVSRRTNAIEPVDARAALGEALRNLASAIEESGAVITSGHLPTVRADGTQLCQLFQNLVGNAVKFRGAEVPQIGIYAEELETAWRFCVKDNGIGIDPQYEEKVFVIFQRLHTRQEFPGTGIGLAICRRIVERHGGELWLESEPGKGSAFHFTLPK